MAVVFEHYTFVVQLHVLDFNLLIFSALDFTSELAGYAVRLHVVGLCAAGIYLPACLEELLVPGAVRMLASQKA